MAEAIARLLEHPKLAAQIALQARQDATRYHLDGYVERVQDLYEAVVRGYPNGTVLKAAPTRAEYVKVKV